MLEAIVWKIVWIWVEFFEVGYLLFVSNLEISAVMFWLESQPRTRALSLGTIETFLAFYGNAYFIVFVSLNIDSSITWVIRFVSCVDNDWKLNILNHEPVTTFRLLIYIYTPYILKYKILYCCYNIFYGYKVEFKRFYKKEIQNKITIVTDKSNLHDSNWRS